MKILRNCFLPLLLMSTLPLAADQIPASSSHSGNVWVASNASIEIAVDKKSGVVEHLVDQVSHEDYCNQTLSNATADTDGNRGVAFTVGPRIGGLVLFDELRNRVFADLSDPGTVTNLKASKDSAGED